MKRAAQSKSARLFRWLLRLLPFDFRWDYGAEMEEVFEEQHMDAEKQGGVMGLMKLWWKTIVGIFRTAPREHWQMLQQDVSCALRMLRRNPGFTAVAVLTLALGIGANTAVFSVVNGVLLRPLPYEEPEQLVYIRFDSPGEGGGTSLAPAEIRNFREQARLFEGFGLVYGYFADVEIDGEVEYVPTSIASDETFPLLRIQPLLGRNFRPEDRSRDTGGSYRSVILGYDFWHRRFGGSRDILGKTLNVGDRERTIIGVLPQSARMLIGSAEVIPERVDVWWPEGVSRWDDYSNHYLKTFARLRPGVTLEQAQAEIDAIAARMIRENSSDYDDGEYRFRVVPLQQDFVAPVQKILLILFAAVGLVLMIACSNVANLLLSRIVAREKEFSIRAALGASRSHILRQVLVESFVLALLAGGAGVLLAHWSVASLQWLKPDALPRMADVRVDGAVLGFSFATALITGLLAGLLPALRLRNQDLNSILKEGGRSLEGVSSGWWKSGLIVGEVALSFVLLAGAGLLIRSFDQLTRAELGFHPENVFTFEIETVGAIGQNDRWPVYRQVLQRVSELPSVLAAGGASGGSSTGSAVPMGSAAGGIDAYAFDEESAASFGPTTATYQYVFPGYFEALDIPFLAGRSFEYLDIDEKRRVVVVNAELARRHWPEENPIGKKVLVAPPGLGFGKTDRVWMEVVGVVPHVRLSSQRDEGGSQIFLPYWRRPWQMSGVVRTEGNPSALIPLVRSALVGVEGARNPRLFSFMERYVNDGLADIRFSATLLLTLAGLGLVLSTVGLFAVISYMVSQRRQEMGIRIALGARPIQIIRLVLRQGLTMVVAGLTVGVLLALALTRYLQAELFHVTPTDPVTYAGVAILLTLVALLACYVPARRATKVDPMVALRYE